MKIQLHELISRLKPDIVVRVERDNFILIEDKASNIDDNLSEYQHYLVKDLYLNMLNKLIITIE